MVSPVRATRKEQADVILTREKMKMDPKTSLFIFLTERGPAPGALLWAPTLPPPLQVLSGSADPLLPDWLFGATTEALGRMTPYMGE